MRVLLVCLSLAALPGIAGTVVIGNANASANGNTDTVIPLTSNNSGYTFQILFAASQFGSVPVGSQFTAIGFRAGG
jgi:hypothetical protein